LNSEGIFSYYKSLDEVEQGCKGSMNLAACEIIVHPTDKTRLDIAVKNEQCIYLKTNNEKDRQKWLVALGSAKANVNTNDCASDNATSKRLSISVSGGGGGHATSAAAVTSSTYDEIKTKKSELRLYCDLLMQQVHTVKQAVTDPTSSSSGGVNLEQLDEGSNLLAKTCDTFISTLDDAMQLAEAAQCAAMASAMAPATTPAAAHHSPTGVVRVGDACVPSQRRASRVHSESSERSPTPSSLMAAESVAAAARKGLSSRVRLASTDSGGGGVQVGKSTPPPATPNGFQSVFGGQRSDIMISPFAHPSKDQTNGTGH